MEVPCSLSNWRGESQARVTVCERVREYGRSRRPWPTDRADLRNVPRRSTRTTPADHARHVRVGVQPVATGPARRPQPTDRFMVSDCVTRQPDRVRYVADLVFLLGRRHRCRSPHSIVRTLRSLNGRLLCEPGARPAGHLSRASHAGHVPRRSRDLGTALPSRWTWASTLWSCQHTSSRASMRCRKRSSASSSSSVS